MLTLYSYFRSSAAYRVRIALNLKNIAHKITPINLLKREHSQAEYEAISPQKLVPALALSDGTVLTQSGAILNYIESFQTAPILLPDDAVLANKVRAFCDVIACDIHPICNLRVLNYLSNTLSIDEHEKNAWYQHWVKEGFSALEKMVGSGKYCFGDEITLADVYLVPQVYNAQRFKVDMSAFPQLLAIVEHCNKEEAFHLAKPENQSDAV